MAGKIGLDINRYAKKLLHVQKKKKAPGIYVVWIVFLGECWRDVEIRH